MSKQVVYVVSDEPCCGGGCNWGIKGVYASKVEAELAVTEAGPYHFVEDVEVR